MLKLSFLKKCRKTGLGTLLQTTMLAEKLERQDAAFALAVAVNL